MKLVRYKKNYFITNNLMKTYYVLKNEQHISIDMMELITDPKLAQRIYKDWGKFSVAPYVCLLGMTKESEVIFSEYSQRGLILSIVKEQQMIGQRNCHETY